MSKRVYNKKNSLFTKVLVHFFLLCNSVTRGIPRQSRTRIQGVGINPTRNNATSGKGLSEQGQII